MMDAVISSHDENTCTESDEEQKCLPRRRNYTEINSSTPNQDPNSSPNSQAEQRMRRRLQFFFMNPIEKWQAKRKLPYKFGVQVVKIFLVTFQLCLFAHTRYVHVNYTWDNRVTFSHLFLRGWDATREINIYPPSLGPLAVYVIDDFYDTVDFAYNGYSNISSAVGSYSYPNEDNTMMNPRLCLYLYKVGIIHGFNESYTFNPEIEESCYDVVKNKSGDFFSVRNFLKRQDVTINFSALVRASLSFSVKTVNFKAAGPITPPDCYRFDIVINFNNEDHDGQMVIDLDADAVRLICKGDKNYETDNKIDQILRSSLNIFVILICSVSLILCSRAIYRAQQLKNVTVNFFRSYYDKELTVDGKLEFLNVWYIMIIVNDILIIMGSAIKEQIERKQFTNDQWNVCSVFLGTGNLLVWFGVLRYLGFFKTYNVVILTLKRAAPKISRFLLCALLIYAGFTFCGWLIFGPYHIKFRSLATTSECLFSLINGDDMFATFAIMSTKSSMLWWFSRIYLYSFISLYIYVVLSLFISVIMDAYDTIKRYYKDGFPKSDLQIFIGTMQLEDLSSGIFRSESTTSLNTLIASVCCCNVIKNTYSKIDSRTTPKSSTSTGAICI